MTFDRPLTAPGGQQYWLTVVPAGTPDNEWGTWHYVAAGATSDTIQATKTGATEVRLHDYYPKHPFGVLARATVTVSDNTLSVSMSLAKTTFAVGEKITVTFSRTLATPAGEQHWLALCPQGADDSTYGEWHYVPQGARSDTITPTKHGTFEVRLHNLYPLHPYGVIARETVTVR